MAKNSGILGKYIAPGTIKITNNNDRRLFNGQKVLIYRPTTQDIISCSTGKPMGKREKILGSGTVVVKGGQPMVKINQDNHMTSNLPKAGSYRIMGKPSVPSKKNFVKHTTRQRDVLIKLIDE